ERICDSSVIQDGMRWTGMPAVADRTHGRGHLEARLLHSSPPGIDVGRTQLRARSGASSSVAERARCTTDRQALKASPRMQIRVGFSLIDPTSTTTACLR